MTELKRVEVVYDASEDRTELTWERGDCKYTCFIDGDITQDEERLVIEDEITALHFKRWPR